MHPRRNDISVLRAIPTGSILSVKALFSSLPHGLCAKPQGKKLGILDTNGRPKNLANAIFTAYLVGKVERRGGKLEVKNL